ncbi:hypothetical protein CIL05_15330 [Virgibacillus profundi]|uniref:VanZ-like domain-containing protein n=1 Tax=Virgibacillus profundi TaxID=2024555 RepID=A0A2A2IC60_9BACI|nr:VanZ family protein [Virgibacillus profundi]PAV28663.1 hypothetical protein CIL05_15330 [Virgibacillus profundi]PXY52831.1 VanZ family protein [Virgibacillus profundi]
MLDFIYTLPIYFMTLTVIVYIPIRLSLLKRRNNEVSLYKEFIYILSIIYLESLLYLTIFPASSSIEGWTGINILPFHTINGYLYLFSQGYTETAIINLVGNVVVFVPIGILLVLIYKKHTFKKMLLIGFLCSLGIEITQLVLSSLHILSRSFDIDDLILNTLGVMCGYLLMKIILNINKTKT